MNYILEMSKSQKYKYKKLHAAISTVLEIKVQSNLEITVFRQYCIECKGKKKSFCEASMTIQARE